MKGWSLLAVLVVAFPASSFLRAETHAPQPQPDPPVVLPPLIVSEHTQRRVIYESRTKALWKDTRRTKSITYRDVMALAYDPRKFDLDLCLQEKRRYRENVQRRHVFFCNYDAISLPVTIEWQSAGKRTFNTTLRQGFGYDMQRQTVTLAFDAPYAALLHAAGASLAGHATGRALARLHDLANRKNENGIVRKIRFELSLQDLNRYYATCTGKPITSPLESLRALVMLGHKPDLKVVQSIFRSYALNYTNEQLSWAMETPNAKRDGRHDTFEHAYRLVDGMAAMAYTDSSQQGLLVQSLRPLSGLNQLKDVRPASYEQFLTNILIEAPGHI